jgi:hypothetical protein
MSNFSMSDMLRKLAFRLDGVQEMLTGPLEQAQSPNTAILQKLDALTYQLEELKRTVGVLRTSSEPILPRNPMQGIEVIPKREFVLPEIGPLSTADRLLLNRNAKRALEAEEMGATRNDEYPLNEDYTRMEVDEEVKAEAEVEIELEVEVEEDEDEAEDEDEVEAGPEDDDEDEAEELIEFEYKGSTYYRDLENNVFMTDEYGELVADAIGVWSAEKNKILVKK